MPLKTLKKLHMKFWRKIFEFFIKLQIIRDTRYELKYVNGIASAGETETENTCQRQCLNLSINPPPLRIVTISSTLLWLPLPQQCAQFQECRRRQAKTLETGPADQDYKCLAKQRGEKANRNRQRNGKTFNVNVLSTNVKWPVVLVHVFVLPRHGPKTKHRKGASRVSLGGGLTRLKYTSN